MPNKVPVSWGLVVRKHDFVPYVTNNKSADQPAHQHLSYSLSEKLNSCSCYMPKFSIIRGSRGCAGEFGTPRSLKSNKAIRFLSNTYPHPLQNHKATKPAFDVGPSSDPLLVVFGSSLPLSTEIKGGGGHACQSWTPSDKTFKASLYFIAIKLEKCPRRHA